jgi:hypothetical protein
VRTNNRLPKPRMRWRNALVIAAAAIATSLSFLTTAGGAEADPGDLLIASGTVTDSGGNPGSGADVSLYAWPSDSVLDSLASGQEVPRTLLATTTADATGAYQLFLPPATLSAAAVDGTNANLEVDSGTSEWFFDVDTTNPVMTPIDMPTEFIPQTGGPPPCTTWVYLHQMARDWAAVGSSYIWALAHGVTGHFEYRRAQSSSTGIALKTTTSSAEPVSGGWSASGTNSNSAATGVDYPDKGAADFVEFKTQWKTALYKRTCGSGAFQKWQWHVRKNGYVGGQRIATENDPPSTDAANCVAQPPGTGSAWHTESAKAVTFTQDLGLVMGDISFNATAQTGYDTEARIKYMFGNATDTNYVCGTNNLPHLAKRVVVQSHR